MVQQIEQLSAAVGAISDDAAKQVVDAVNRKLLTLLSAQMIKVYWRSEAERGAVILNPVAYINQMGVPDPQPFPVLPQTVGVLARVFRTGQPLWLERLGSLQADEDLTEHLTRTRVPADELSLPTTGTRADAMLVLPLVERTITYGLYSIELMVNGSFTRPTYDLIERLCRSLSSLLFNVDFYKYDLEKTNIAVARFLDSTRDFKFDPLVAKDTYRTAFVARPFTPQQTGLQDRLQECLRDDGIYARQYVPIGDRYVIEDIISNIRNSHFCIADLSGTTPNSNVLAEIGMMIALRKRLLLLRRRGDGIGVEVPFDLAQYPIWGYELEPEGEFRVWSAGRNEMIPFKMVLQEFLNSLPPEIGFRSAKLYIEDAP